MKNSAKKFFLTILIFVCLFCFSFGLAACGDKGNGGGTTDNGETPVTPSGKTYTVIFDANGGQFDKGEIEIDGEVIDDGSEVSSDGKTLTVVSDSATVFEPYRMPELSRNAFCGWSKDKSGETLWDFEKDELTGDTTTLYAVWAESFDFTLSEDRSHYIVRGIGALSGDVEIPETHNGKPVTEIAKEAFKNSSVLTGIVVPDSVTTIGEGAFRNARKLTNVKLGEGVTTLPVMIFEDCNELEILGLPKSLKSVGERAFGTAFNGNKSLTEVHYAGTIDDWCAIESMESYSDMYTGDYRNPLCNGIAELYINGNKVTEITINAEHINGYAFYLCQTIERVTIGKNVKTIGSKAFYRNAIESLTFAANSELVSIGEEAFTGNDMTALMLADSPATVDVSAFNDCNKLRSVDLNGTQKVYDKAFDNCFLLENLDLGDVEYLGSNVFTGNTVLNEEGSLASVTIPETVWYIGKGCFAAQPALNGVTFSGSAATSTWQVGNENVSGATLTNPATAAAKIKSGSSWIRLFGALTYDNNNVVTGVADKNGVGALAVPATNDGKPVTKIAANAFKGLKGLKNLTVHKNVTQIGDGFVDGCDGLESVSVVADNIAYASQNGMLYKKNGAMLWVSPSVGTTHSTGDLRIPSGVTTVPSGMFANRNIWNIVIPESVTEIGDGAFDGCPIELAEVPVNAIPYILNDVLRSVNITSGTELPEEAFKGCDALEYAWFPDTMTSIGARAFENCTSLKTVTVKEKITEIGDGAFNGCNNIESVTVEKGNTAFVAKDGFLYNADKTEILLITSAVKGEIVIPDGMTEISAGMFANNTNITSIEIPDSVTAIGGGAFDGCTALTEITVSGGNAAFASQNGILYNKDKTQIVFIPQGVTGEVVIPNGVTKIASRAFYGCKGITKITLPDSVTEIGEYAFFGCTALTEIKLPDGVTKIGNSAFRGCNKLTNIVIPSGVTEIANSVFRGCSSLTSITFPSGIENIGYNVFYGCNKLTDINFDGTKADWNIIPKFEFGGKYTVHCTDGDITKD